MDRYAQRLEKLELLNAETIDERLANLERLLKEEKVRPEALPQYANNHIHTFYSFSPYSPTAAVYFAREEGLQTAGIMDHDTIAGADEFRAAGKIAGVGTTCGMECRSSLKGTRLEGKKLNNPDQSGVAYMAIHSVPSCGFKRLSEVFAPLRDRRNERNRKMTDKINALMEPYSIRLDFENDVLPLSQYANGGAVTERHLLFALTKKIIAAEGLANCARFISDKLKVRLDEKTKERLSDPSNPHIEYDLLGVLKAELVEKIYVPADEECISFKELVKLSDEVGAILCYAYLGDVVSSVTGDKKAAKFEDDILDDLFEMLKEEGVHAVTYMPSRNTRAQLERLQGMCKKYGMKEISGEDVNSSRQGMICRQLEDPMFRHLVDAAWELVRRENNGK